MGMFSICLACGSDWCCDCECVRDPLMARIAELETALKATKHFAELALGCIDFPEQAPGEFTACSEAINAAERALAKAGGK